MLSMLGKTSFRLHTNNLDQLLCRDKPLTSCQIVTVDTLINGELHHSQLVQVNCPKSDYYYEIRTSDSEGEARIINLRAFSYWGKIQSVDVIIRGPQCKAITALLNCEIYDA